LPPSVSRGAPAGSSTGAGAPFKSNVPPRTSTSSPGSATTRLSNVVPSFGESSTTTSPRAGPRRGVKNASVKGTRRPNASLLTST
jgi:hypothetical protein